MKITDLGDEYMRQYEAIRKRMRELAPQRRTLSGNELHQFDRKMTILNDMAIECKMTAYSLKNYYEEE